MIKLVPRIRKIFIKKIKLPPESICKVTLINFANGSYDYLVPKALSIGQIVVVPLRKRLCIGVVISRGTSNISRKKLRYINKNGVKSWITKRLYGSEWCRAASKCHHDKKRKSKKSAKNKK